MSACKVEGCLRERRYRAGWCSVHYQRWRTTGTTELRARAARRCKAPACEAKVLAKDLCSIHYKRMRVSGWFEPPTTIERFEAKTAKQPAGCWIWQGRPAVTGYGVMSVNDVVQLAHRLSYELYVGPIPAGLTIDHLCRVRLCVNPSHLEVVTRAENTRRELLVRYSA